MGGVDIGEAGPMKTVRVLGKLFCEPKTIPKIVGGFSWFIFFRRKKSCGNIYKIHVLVTTGLLPFISMSITTILILRPDCFYLKRKRNKHVKSLKGCLCVCVFKQSLVCSWRSEFCKPTFLFAICAFTQQAPRTLQL